MISTRNKEAAKQYIDKLQARLQLDDVNDFWIKSVEIKKGKVVHRVMIGRFTDKSQAKTFKKKFRKIKEKPILKKLK